MAGTAPKAVLHGGPKDLAGSIVENPAPGEDLKIPLRGGYEHFKPTSDKEDTPQGQLPVYEWWERTELPG
jgi:hypothetical protein